MIYDKISNIDSYMGISENLDKALAHIKSNDFASSSAGRNEVDADEVYYNFVSDGQTVAEDQTAYEAHRKYIDIHVDVKGGEIINTAHIDAVTATTEYDEAGDYFLLKGEAEASIKLKPGYFCACFPSDAHMPMVAENGVSSKITKAIYKVKVK